MMWFLVALFLSRSLFDYLHLKFGDSKKLIVAVVLCSLLGIAIGKIQWLPFDLDIVLAILPFMCFGNSMKKINIEKRTFLGCAVSATFFFGLLLLEFVICKTYLEIACRRYPIFPVSFVIAAAGTMFVSYFCQILERTKFFCWLEFLGRNSFLIFTVHALDYFYKSAWKLIENNIANGFIRCAEDVAVMLGIYFFVQAIKKKRKKYIAHKNMILETENNN